MKNKGLSLLSIALLAASIGSLTGCSSNDGSLVLRVLNLEDYIYVNEDEPGTPEEEASLPDLTIQFEEYIKENYDKDIEVVYDTTDTNETLYNELLTGKSKYDVICTSDYMLQKIIANNLAVELNKDLLPNYNQYASAIIKERLDEIETTIKPHNGEDAKTVKLEDYCVGYMWGTLGLIFNPTYEGFVDIDEDEAIADMQSFHSLWDEKYHGTFSIKDSMRDTYALALMEEFDSELSELRIRYLNDEIDSEQYNIELSEIFNRCDSDTIEKVQATMKDLKENAFGLECDSGKQDIVTGKIGMNLAWSGDAVYSMDQAEDPEEVSDPFELWYSIPENGSNIWFDGWCIPKLEDRSDEVFELAHLFLDFISMPENVAQNMDYSGYTSFVGGDSILELVRDWYDIRTSYMYATEDYFDVYYYENDDYDTEPIYVDYDLFLEADLDMNNPALYFEDDEGEEQVFLDPMADDEDSAKELHYNDLLDILNGEDIETVDLTYFFDGTLEEYCADDMIFYTDCYLPAINEDGTQNICCGRQFFCQYPDEETIIRCAVMRDYGDESNKLIMKMWEDFKSDPLPGWAIALFVIEGVAIVGLMTYFVLNKKIKISQREKRISQQ